MKNHFDAIASWQKAPEREITLIFIFKDASPSLSFPVLRRQTPSPKLLKGVIRSGARGWKADGILSAGAVFEDARLSPLVRRSARHYIIHESEGGQKNPLESSSVSWEMLCGNIKCNTGAPLPGNVCPGAGIGCPAHIPPNCKRSRG